MPALGQRVSPAELASLEHAFAADPASESYRPLAEAYLAMGRFMEAMVVAKRGSKSHPHDAFPRLLLARVYAAQRKDDKALEEVREALKLSPTDPAALRLLATLHLRRGEREPGVAALRQAWEAVPDDPETAALAAEHGVSVKQPVVAPPPPTLRPTKAPSVEPGAAAPEGSAPSRAAGSAAPAPRAPDAQPRPTPVLEEELEAHPHRRGTLVVTTVLVVVLAVALIGWGIASGVKKRRAVEIDHLLRQSRDLIEKDAFASYREAARLCERILERDPDAVGGHAYLAYIDAIRWGDLGEGEALRAEAQRHLEAAQKLRRSHSHAYAAQAYLKAYGGDPRLAISQLQEVLKGPEGASPLLRSVLGQIQMQAGDLDGAREALTYARQHAPGDVRSAQMLAEQWRRRGRGFEGQASALYDAILTRLAPDHVPSLLGKAQLLVDAGQPAEALKRVGRVLDLGQNVAPRQIALAHAVRGSILYAQGKPGEGEAAEQKALGLEPASADVQELIGLRKLRGGDATGAVASFQKCLQLDPQRLAFYVDLANALLRTPGGARDAIAALERASEKAQNARVTKLLGDAYRSAGDADRARASYERALEMEKKYPDALVELAAIDRERKDYPRALQELERAVKEFGDGNPGAATAWVGIAEIEEARGGAPATIASAYASALKADPQSCPALFGLGRSRASRVSGNHDPESAAQLMGEYLRLCPRGPHAAEAQSLMTPPKRATSSPKRSRSRH